MEYLASVNGTEVQILVGVGAFFVVFGLYMMLRPLDEAPVTRIRICGARFSAPSVGLLVFALGVLFLVDTLLAPGVAAQAASVMAMKTALELVAETGASPTAVNSGIGEVIRLRRMSIV